MRYKKCSGKINLAKYCPLQKTFFFCSGQFSEKGVCLICRKHFLKFRNHFLKFRHHFTEVRFCLTYFDCMGIQRVLFFQTLCRLLHCRPLEIKKTDLFADFLRASQILKYIIIYKNLGYWWRSLCTLCIISNYYYQLNNLLFRNKKKIIVKTELEKKVVTMTRISWGPF